MWPQVKRRLDQLLSPHREVESLPVREPGFFLGNNQSQPIEDPQRSGNGLMRMPEVTINRRLRRRATLVQVNENMQSPGLAIEVPKVGPVLQSLAAQIFDRAGVRSPTLPPGSLPKCSPEPLDA